MKSNFWKYERGTFRKFNFDKAVKDINEQYQTLKEIDLGSAKGKTSTYLFNFLDETIVSMNDALACIIQFNLFNNKLKDRYLSEEETINYYDSIIDVVRSEMYYKIIETIEDINK